MDASDKSFLILMAIFFVAVILFEQYGHIKRIDQITPANIPPGDMNRFPLSLKETNGPSRDSNIPIYRDESITVDAAAFISDVQAARENG